MNMEELKEGYAEWRKSQSPMRQMALSIFPGAPGWEAYVADIVLPAVKKDSYDEGYGDALDAWNDAEGGISK